MKKTLQNLIIICPALHRADNSEVLHYENKVLHYDTMLFDNYLFITVKKFKKLNYLGHRGKNNANTPKNEKHGIIMKATKFMCFSN